MNTDHNPEFNEQRLAALLRTIDADTPPPDPVVLDALAKRTASLFAQNATVQPPSEFTSHRSRTMTLVIRTLLAVSSIAAGIMSWIFFAPSDSVVASVSFSQVLNELRAANSLQFQLSQSGKSVDVWVRAPGLVRREESPQRYQIAAGSRMWQVDEIENTVIESESTWFLNPDESVDLLELLDVGITDGSALLNARPKQTIQRDGRDLLVYRVALPGRDKRVAVEALADAKTLQLVELVAWADDGNQRRGPPLAEMRLVAINPPVNDEKFVVAKSLTEDGRIGTVGQAQGIVALRPMLARRWTPLSRELSLKAGDWLRTERRGANGAAILMSSNIKITLGPGSLIEFMSPVRARLHYGVAQLDIAPAKDGDQPAFTLLAPREGERSFKAGEKRLVRADAGQQLVDVPSKPVWLSGFEGTTNDESLGSLIVQLPDGRNEPLSVGYHKVTVEIRDQIARTTIEESFVNHTPNRLEGVFHFPLPNDASISGFGMWIGNDLIEADVVEKQRAREIYETILRERRDPGLLEWTSGNIFKARVFPIEGRSEKRIKIVYTQVLPLQANRYRYVYGLRSELLRTKPLRELAFQITVNSALPLKNVTCPTHPVRTQLTGNSAQLEFTAQEYSPSRDLEVVCEVDGSQSDVVIVPHRRGEDGYFLLQLTPPATTGNWQRQLLPDGQPVKLVLMCDTSASMDQEKRNQQAELIAAVLTSLGPEDRFQLAAADVNLDFLTSEPQAPTAENVQNALTRLRERTSLGWTNLDRAFEEILKRATDGSHIVYVGDGMLSTGDADPSAFSKRMEARLAGAKHALTVHAIAVGNANDQVALEGIVAAGHGSLRAIGTDQSPQVVAFELLNEIAQPGLRDIEVAFKGVKVAAVYPGRLPNLPAGTQQILVGRYLPEGQDQTGEVIVTGKRGGETVRYAARIALRDAEQSNSFIPRLWREHI